MDVIVEGKISPEEPIADVIETLVELKNFQHLVLRITAADDDLEGRVAFSHGGYILGGRINNTNDSGYPAIHKLLSVKKGNYAILDPGRQQIADINQTLWILSDRVRERLPNLPTSPVGLFDADRNHGADYESAGTAGSAETKNNGAVEASGAAIGDFAYPRLNQPAPETAAKSTIHNVKGKARSFNASAWFVIQWICMLLLCVTIATGFAFLWSFKGKMLEPPAKNSILKLKPSKSYKDAKDAAKDGGKPQGKLSGRNE